MDSSFIIVSFLSESLQTLSPCQNYLLHQHKLSVESLLLTARGGTLVSVFGTSNSDAELHLTFNVLFRQFSFFGEADDARCLLELPHFWTLSSSFAKASDKALSSLWQPPLVNDGLGEVGEEQQPV